MIKSWRKRSLLWVELRVQDSDSSHPVALALECPDVTHNTRGRGPGVGYTLSLFWIRSCFFVMIASLRGCSVYDRQQYKHTLTLALYTYVI